MKKLAHRGYSGKYPENTMIAFEKALEKGFDGIETDVHMTLDGYLVLCHDESIDRTSNGTGYIKDMTLEQLRAYSFSNKTKYQQKIPLLKDLLLLIKDKDVLLNIELKTDCFHYEGLEKKVYDLVKEIGVEKQVLYSSFYLPSLLKIREIDKDVYIGYLFENDIEKKNEELLDYQFKFAHPDICLLNDENLLFYQQNHIELAVWTIKSEEQYLWIKEKNMKIMISNDYFV